MDLILIRKDKTAEGIFSELRDTDGKLWAVTCEHSYQDSDGNWLPKIPDGTFTCVRGQHQLAHMTSPFTTFEITGVEGHSNILFHPGNAENDSEGCVLTGEQRVGNAVTNSRVTFQKFIEGQEGVDEFSLTVQ